MITRTKPENGDPFKQESRDRFRHILESHLPLSQSYHLGTIQSSHGHLMTTYVMAEAPVLCSKVCCFVLGVVKCNFILKCFSDPPLCLLILFYTLNIQIFCMLMLPLNFASSSVFIRRHTFSHGNIYYMKKLNQRSRQTKTAPGGILLHTSLQHYDCLFSINSYHLPSNYPLFSSYTHPLLKLMILYVVQKVNKQSPS